VGDAVASTGRLSSLQAVFSNEVADEERSSGEDQPAGERNAAESGSGFWHSGGSVKLFWHSFGTVDGQIGLLEQHPRWQVPYNQYAPHVGA
jgi:hypothetical protein